MHKSYSLCSLTHASSRHTVQPVTFFVFRSQIAKSNQKVRPARQERACVHGQSLFFPEMCSTVVMATGQLTFWKTARRRLLQFVVTWIGDAEPAYLQTLQYPVHHSHEIVYKKWNGKYALFITPTLHGVRFRIYILDLRGVWMAGVKPRTPMSTVNACRAFLGRYWNNHCMFGAI